MDFSLQLLPEQPLAELIEVIRVADELGFAPATAPMRPITRTCGSSLRPLRPGRTGYALALR
jgi:hypothetical protein